MSILTNGPFQFGTTQFIEISKNETQRLFVLETSNPGKPRTVQVTRRLLPKTASRPFEIMQVSIVTQEPQTSVEDTAISGFDTSTFTVQLPLFTAASTLKARLLAVVNRALAYMSGGYDNTELTALGTAIGDLCADDWAIGRI